MTDAIECDMCGSEDCHPYYGNGKNVWLCDDCYAELKDES